MKSKADQEREKLLLDLARMEERLREFGLPPVKEVLTHAFRVADEGTAELLQKALLGLEKITSSQRSSKASDDGTAGA